MPDQIGNVTPDSTPDQARMSDPPPGISPTINVPFFQNDEQAVKFGELMEADWYQSVLARIQTLDQLIATEKIDKNKIDYALRRKRLRACAQAYQRKQGGAGA